MRCTSSSSSLLLLLKDLLPGLEPVVPLVVVCVVCTLVVKEQYNFLLAVLEIQRLRLHILAGVHSLTPACVQQEDNTV